MLELGTYLDTHPDDTEAFELFKQYSAMEQSAKAAYEQIRPHHQDQRRRRQLLPLASGPVALELWAE